MSPRHRAARVRFIQNRRPRQRPRRELPRRLNHIGRLLHRAAQGLGILELRPVGELYSRGAMEQSQVNPVSQPGRRGLLGEIQRLHRDQPIPPPRNIHGLHVGSDVIRLRHLRRRLHYQAVEPLLEPDRRPVVAQPADQDEMPGIGLSQRGRPGRHRVRVGLLAIEGVVNAGASDVSRAARIYVPHPIGRNPARLLYLLSQESFSSPRSRYMPPR